MSGTGAHWRGKQDPDSGPLWPYEVFGLYLKSNRIPLKVNNLYYTNIYVFQRSSVWLQNRE